MTASPDVPLPAASPAPAIDACFGRPPLVPGDDPSAYEALLGRVCAAVRPRDVIEEAWVRDVVDLLWDAVRLRRLRAALMTACADEGLQKLLTGLDYRADTYGLSRRWAARDLAAVGQVDTILNGAGLGLEHVMARTLRQTIGEVERIDRMIASAEVRRVAILREIERYRGAFGATLRRAAQEADVQEADFEDVPPIAPAGAAAPDARPAAAVA